MADSRQLLGQFGIQCVFACPPPQSELMQVVMAGYDHPEAGVYNCGGHIPYHLHKTNDLVFPPTLLEEDHCGPGQLHW